ncbi:uncharacterized protein BO66DRAFT_442961 [Aspergillus aculeatinus CBS 121060]|uniref:Uncharacterized protein n=1 Tax=Aspergillus aculeatinus CBS 121060 TaxID=1448322 RepID=A0ACD1GWJ3_9EURO|nr:hypothetical protein BO66DRAFT_442961 [Aspergillus aculeatinus CBS 121060]RAH65554.1 hypothetical protein BO66DRAFT_442961 [Aspergillus aculeatinus CBS 121060]
MASTQDIGKHRSFLRFARGIREKFGSTGQSKKQKKIPGLLPSHTRSSTAPAFSGVEAVTSNYSQSGRESQTALATTLPASPPPSDLWQEALQKARESNDWKEHQEEYDEAIRECQAHNQKLLHKQGGGTTTDLADAILARLSSLHKQHDDTRWAYAKADGETIYFRDVVFRIMQWVKVFKDPGNLLADLDPTKAASVVWGLVQFFVERSIAYGETRDLALDQEPIANLISRYALVEKFYLRKRPGTSIETVEPIKEKVVELYSAVLLYQLDVYRFWKQGKITHGIQSLVPHKLKDLSNAIQQRSTQVESALRLNDRELLGSIFDNVQLKEPIANIGGQLQQILDIVTILQEEKYSKVLDWVSPVRHLDQHRTIRPMEGTGQWLLGHPQFMDWRQSHHSGLFWLRGKMGAGKTNLVSSLVSHLLDASPKNGERIAFFYVDEANRASEAKSAQLILNSLLKQLCTGGAKTFVKGVVDRYNDLQTASSSPDREDCISLLVGIVKQSRQTNIIIDGIDELGVDDDRNELLQTSKKVADESSPTGVKIFISSRDHVNISTLMDEIWQVRWELLIDQQNQQDIDRFITSRVRTLEKSLFLSSPIPEDVKNEVESTLKQRASGMFLWVHLSLEYLRRIKAKEPDTFVAKLQAVPPTPKASILNS